MGNPWGLNGIFCETADVPRRPQFATLPERIDQLMLDVFSAVVEGPQGLSDAYSTYRHDEWLQVALRRTTEVDMHHAHFRFAWEHLERGKIVSTGWSFGLVDAAGK